jgi:ABC-type polysaccharide/polyol phosphate export permease
MNMVFDLLVFVTGIVYGYTTQGRENKVKLFKNGLLLGVGVGVIFGTLNLTYRGLAGFLATFIMSVYWISLLTALFIGGTITGGFLEGKIKKR